MDSSETTLNGQSSLSYIRKKKPDYDSIETQHVLEARRWKVSLEGSRVWNSGGVMLIGS